MQNKFLLTFTLFVAYASIALAATGDSCTNAQTITVDLNSTPRIDFSVTPFTPPANSLNAVSGFTQDPCKYPGSADPDQSANKVYWFKWAPSADTLASMELTNANRSYYYTERVLIISTNGVAPCTNNVNWNCEGQILNECQGYTSTVGGNSVQPAAYNFRQGRTYYFLVNTVNDTAAQLFFALVHKIQFTVKILSQLLLETYQVVGQETAHLYTEDGTFLRFLKQTHSTLTSVKSIQIQSEESVQKSYI